MMLGDILAGLDEPQATEIILGLGDLSLLGSLRAQAEAECVDLATYARAAVQRYIAQASDEEWITLMGQLARSDDPGGVCLKRAFAVARQH